MENINQAYYLPHKFKLIGWSLIGFHLCTVLLLILLSDVLNIIPVTNTGAVIVSLFQYTLMVGLAVVISSREKQEDEMIRLIRLKSFQYGLYTSVFVAVALFIFTLIPFSNVKISGFWIYPSSLVTGLDTISATLIYIVAIYQYQLYKLRSDEE